MKRSEVYEFPRYSFLRLFALVYLVAFASLFVQFQGLFGRDGLEPVDRFVHFKRLQLPSHIRDDPFQMYLSYPSFIWFAKFTPLLPLDVFMELTCLVGVILSTLSALGYINLVCFGFLWLLYLSVYLVGQTFLSFQWDLLLLECGFLVIWLCPPLGRISESKSYLFESPSVVVWALRFSLFKLMLMAGAVKIQSRCPTWLQLTALEYHYATQPLALPIGWYAYQLPPIFQRFCVAATLLIEGPITVFLLSPFNTIRLMGAFFQLKLMFGIILTGNYNFFNLLTCLLCYGAYDMHEKISPIFSDHKNVYLFDRLSFNINTNKYFVRIQYLLSIIFLAFCTKFMFGVEYKKNLSSPTYFMEGTILRLKLSPEDFQNLLGSVLPLITKLIILILVAEFLKQIWRALYLMCIIPGKIMKLMALWNIIYLLLGSIMGGIAFNSSLATLSTLDPPFQNALPPYALSFYHATSKWHIASPYGLFRRMTGVGENTNLSATMINGVLPPIVARPEIILEGSNDSGKSWYPYHFVYKPGDVHTRPKFATPHQPRLDWQMWFAALGDYTHAPWFIHLVDKLLEGSRSVKGLLDIERDPFPNSTPNMIRSRLFYYDFTRWNSSWSRMIPSAVILSQGGGPSQWWTRKFVNDFTPPVERRNPSVTKFLENYKWKRINARKLLNRCTCTIKDKSGRTDRTFFGLFQCSVCNFMEVVHWDYHENMLIFSIVILIVILSKASSGKVQFIKEQKIKTD